MFLGKASLASAVIFMCSLARFGQTQASNPPVVMAPPADRGGCTFGGRTDAHATF
jgi:hypothetical protein